jgi:hypothetical protein
MDRKNFDKDGDMLLTFFIEKNFYLLSTILASLIGGLFINSVRGYVHLPQKNTIPVAIQISLLLFGLTRYYSTPISRDKDYPSKCVKKARWIYMQTQSSWEIRKYHERRL